jgi:PAS domain S-box-containing protein
MLSGQSELNVEHQQSESLQNVEHSENREAITASPKQFNNLYALLKQAPAAIALLKGQNHIFEFANPLYMQLVGNRDVIGKPVADALPEISGQGFIQLLDNVYTTGKPFTGTEILVKLDRYGKGELEDCYLNFVYQPIKDAQGSIEGILVHAVEVTEQVKARQIVEENERRYRTLFNSVDEGFCVIEKVQDNPLDFRYIEANPAFGVQSGVSDVVGKTIRQAFPGEAEEWFETYDIILQTGQPVRFQRGLLTPGRVLELYAFRVEDETHLRVAVIFKDITESLLARQKLQENEEKYRSLFETMDQGFCILEVIFDADNQPVDYRFLEINPTFEEQSGLIQAVGKTARELVPNLESHWFELYGDVALTGKPNHFIDGSEAMGRWFEVYAFRLGGGDSRKVALLFTNITERKRAEAERTQLFEAERKARQEAERANQVKMLFLAMISHELRTPLASIKGFASTILATDVQWDADSQREFIQIIEDEADKLQGLIEELLDISRLQNGTFSVNQTVLLPADLLRDAQPQLQALTSQHSLRINIPPTLPALYADRGRIVQVITNLVSNAAKYSPSGTTITLSSHHQNGWVEFRVSDEGLGIPVDKQQAVFEPFYQLEGGKKGVGLGLAICKGIVEAHGGRIWIADKASPGTIISFTLPTTPS